MIRRLISWLKREHTGDYCQRCNRWLAMDRGMPQRELKCPR